MEKKYIVRLDDQEREELKQVAKLSGSSQKVRRANCGSIFVPPFSYQQN